MEDDPSRRSLVGLLAGFGLASVAFAAPALEVRLGGDGLRLAAPQLHFLQGKLLERLKNGGAVAINLQVILSVDSKSTVFRRETGRFVYSYDLWEEKFAVTRTLPSRRGVTHLTVEAAESWCLDSLPVPTEGLAPDRQFWVKLDLRHDDGANPSSGSGFPPISLASLIEIFSRNARPQQTGWQSEGGPWRLAEIRK